MYLIFDPLILIATTVKIIIMVIVIPIIMIMVNTIVKAIQLQSPPKIPVVEESLQAETSIQTARD